MGRPEGGDDDRGRFEGPFDLERVGQIITKPRGEAFVLEDFRPIWDSLDLRLARAYWQHQGIEAFFGGDVPYGITSDGRLAAKAAETTLAGLRAAADKGELGETVHLLELGAGSGLFAKLFLDRLKALAPDFYDRTRYVASDGTQRMLDEIESCAVLADHRDHVSLVRCNAAEPLAELTAPGVELPGRGGYQAVFANYLLDALPFTILARHGQNLWELQHRTVIDPDADLSLYSKLTPDELRERLLNDDPETLGDLLHLHRACVVDSRYQPVTREALAFAEAIPDEPADEALIYLHSYGALRCVAEAFELIRPGGFLLVSDYGYTGDGTRKDVFEFQHFGESVACPVNLFALCQHFARDPAMTVVGPETDPESLFSRLIARQPDEALTEAFKDQFGKEGWDRLAAPANEARAHLENKEIEAARWKFQEAIALQPTNWMLLEEAAGFLLYNCKDHDAALELAMEGLKLNSVSPKLWNLLGDCFFALEDLDKAETAYQSAMALNSGDVLARLNMVYIHMRRHAYAEALASIAEALSLDLELRYRETLMEKQDQVLEMIVSKRRDELQRAINRFRGRRGLPGRP